MFYKGSLSKAQYLLLTQKIANLTESEQHLHDYIIERFNELPYYGIVDLANNVKISKATIGRFLNKLGFMGYASFKRALEENIAQQKIVPPFAMATKAKDKLSNVTAHVISNFSKNVADLLAQFTTNLNTHHIEAFVNLILDPERHIYVVGPASSFAMAKHFSTLLAYFRSEVSLLSVDISKLPKSLVNVSSKDVLVVFSYYRFNSVAINISKWFRRKEAVVTVVTNAETNPYAKFSDLQFILPSETKTLFQSRLIGFFFIELVLQLMHERRSCKGNFEQLEELFEFFDTFSATS